MEFEIAWSEPAADDLQRIAEYVAQHRAASAQRIVDEILQRVSLLKTVPNIGAVFPRGQSTTYREIGVG